MKSLTRWSAAAAALLLAVQACAPATSGISSSPSAPLHERTVISADEVAALRLPDLHSVVRTLHPEWLRVEGEIGVFVHGARRGDAQALAALPAADSVQVRFLDAAALAREGARLDASGLAAAILVEAPAPVAAPLVQRLGFTLAASGFFSPNPSIDPFEGRDNYTLLEDPTDGGMGGLVAARLTFGNVYVEPFYVFAPSSQAAVYEHVVTPRRDVARDLTPQAGILAGYELGIVRAGVGVQMEEVEWNWSSSTCQCTSLGFQKETIYLPIAQVAAGLPVWRMVGAELRVTGRFRPDQEVVIREFYDGGFTMEGATEVNVALGLSARLF